jgi:hypothetical protein
MKITFKLPKLKGNAVAKALCGPRFKAKIVLSKKAFKRQSKHRSLEQ